MEQSGITEKCIEEEAKKAKDLIENIIPLYLITDSSNNEGYDEKEYEIHETMLLKECDKIFKVCNFACKNDCKKAWGEVNTFLRNLYEKLLKKNDYKNN